MQGATDAGEAVLSAAEHEAVLEALASAVLLGLGQSDLSVGLVALAGSVEMA